MINKKQIKQLISEILNELSLGGAQAESLVYHTGLVESKYQYLMQVKGPAIGLFQCETPTAIDICLHYLKYRTELMKKYRKSLWQICVTLWTRGQKNGAN